MTTTRTQGRSHKRRRLLAAVWIVLAGAAGLDGATDSPRQLPATIEAKLARLARDPAPPLPFDAPDLAYRHNRAKRLAGSGQREASELYRRARAHLDRMPRHSIRRGGKLLGPPEFRAAMALDRWTPLGPGNIGGRTRALVIHPNKPRVMYAGGVSGGIWKTTNSGRRWTPIGDDLINLAVNALAMDPKDPKTLYAGTGEGFFRETVRQTSLPLRGGGVFKSSDAGKTWQRLPSTTGAKFRWVNDLIVSPHDSQRIYAATRKGVFRSKNGGQSWKRVVRTRVKGGCLDLAARTDLATDALFAACGTLDQATVFRKLDAEKGGKWQPVLSEPGMGRVSLAIAPSEQTTVYALAASNEPGPDGNFLQGLFGVLRSDDGGAAGTWRVTVRNDDPRKINRAILSNPVIAFLEECGFSGANQFLSMGWYVNTIAVDPQNPERVWAGGVDLFRSDDGGRNWNPVTYWWDNPGGRNFVHADHHGLLFHPKKKNTLFSLNDGGIYRTTNANAVVPTGDLTVCTPGSSAVTWQPLNNGYGVTQFYHGTPFPDGESYMGGTQDNGTVLGRTSLGADDWVRILGGDGGYSAVDPTNPNVIYASTQNGDVRKSTNGGASFVQSVNGITDLATNASPDFRAVGPNFLFISPLVMDPNQPSRLWSGGRRLWRTDDGAGQWGAAGAAWSDGGKASAIAVAPGESDVVLAGTDRGSVFRHDSATTTVATTTWLGTKPRSGFVSSLAFDPLDSSVVYATYAGFGGDHVWQSVDGGSSWTSIDGRGATGIPNIPVHSIVVDPNDRQRLFLGTDLGVFVSTDGGANWAVENTGFARAVTESLALAEAASGEIYLFAFTHGRGAWRVALR